MPYRGKQSLELGDASRPVVVVHGQNMAGKSSIFNALRWALYGEARDRKGAAIPDSHVLNKRALEASELAFSVRVTVQEPGATSGDPPSTHVIHRDARGKVRNGGQPTFTQTLEIHTPDGTKDGLFAAQYVENLLPNDISRFFLFDGEMLNEYEDLVRESTGVSKKKVRDAIESILGLPALTHGTDDLESVAADIDKEIRKLAKNESNVSDLQMQATSIEEKIASLEADIVAAKDALMDAKSEVERIDAQLFHFEESREDARRQTELEKRLAAIKADRKAHSARRLELASNLWRDVLAESLKKRADALASEHRDYEAAREKIAIATKRRSEIEDSLASSTCESCGQHLPEATITTWKLTFKTLVSEIKALNESVDEDRGQQIVAALQTFGRVAPAGVTAAIVDCEEAINRLNIEEFDAQQDLKAIQQRLVEGRADEIQQLSKQRDTLQRGIGENTGIIAQRVDESQRQRSALADLTRRIGNSNNPKMAVLRRESEIARQLANVFQLATERFLIEMKKQVEARASEIFLSLTTDSSYTGLSINDDYGLSILDRDGKHVAIRSAGAEQIVAFSLIGALNALAVKRGPLIIDTPFGRLDSGHRRGILESLPRIADQVVLLVHDGEVGRDSNDLAPLRKSIAREYEICRTAAGDSTLEVMI